MRTYLRTYLCLILLSAPCLGFSQAAIVLDPKALVQSAKQFAQDHEHHIAEIRSMRKALEVAKQTQAELAEIKAFQARVEARMKSLGGLKELSLTEIEQLLEAYFCLELDPGDYYGTSEHASQIAQLLKGGYCKEDAQALYQYLNPAGGKTPAKTQRQYIQRQYEAEVLAQKRHYQLAQMYEALSEDLMEKAAELRAVITREDGALQMTAGERAAALASVQELSLQALEMKRKSIEALTKANQGGRYIQQKAAIEQRAQRRKARLERLDEWLEK